MTADTSGRQAKFVRSAAFDASFAEHRLRSPEIEASFKEFLAAKAKRPPDKVPTDHKLNPPFKQVRQCHLAGDSCLLYRDENDVVALLYVATHDEMSGKRAKRLSRRVNP